MTTAHRPTFDPARGKEAQRGPAYHQRLLPAHTQLKLRKPGQGDRAEHEGRDLRSQLLEAEAVHFDKARGESSKDGHASTAATQVQGDTSESHGTPDSDAKEAPDAKRRRVLTETRALDAESEASESDASEESDDEDETAELMRELERIKKERAEQRAKEADEKAAEEQEEREKDVAMGNPLLQPTTTFSVKRRWDDDVVFKNQARGTEDKREKEFVNDLLRSDFHKRFMNRYVK